MFCHLYEKNVKICNFANRNLHYDRKSRDFSLLFPFKKVVRSQDAPKRDRFRLRSEEERWAHSFRRD